MAGTFDAHYARVTAALADGQVVPLLGAGVNLCDRPAGADWQERSCSPSGGELAQHLAGVFWYPKGEPLDLLRVSQWAVAREGPGPLYDELRKLFDAEYAPTRVHLFLAALPGVLRERGNAAAPGDRHDELRRRARARLRRRGRGVRRRLVHRRRRATGEFWHRPPDGEPRMIERPKLVRRARARGADGDPEDPRRRRPQPSPTATAT